MPPMISSSSSSTSSAPPSHPTPSSPRHPDIRILVHPSPVHVGYEAVRSLVPRLWGSDAPPRIDYMVHVGMAAGRPFYSVERRGHRDGYVLPDVDGVVLADKQHQRRNDEDKGARDNWVWEGCPEELESDVDLDDVWVRWRSALPDLDLRVSEDAGHYLCDFIYYSSLAHLWKMEDERRVAFLHVPGDSSEAAIEMGREVLIELIRALVQSGETKRLLRGGDGSLSV
ncbi:MAG: hypothetical protein M1818_005871 [Claussenomyces sp. TS43310]|nr:MAG: hypothetical protein M1818_005871 [Claussenomyces sp. TS43310]